MAKHISVKGTVPRVEFAPLVRGLATQLNLHGWVCNTPEGAEILVQGPAVDLDSFLLHLQQELSTAAGIAEMLVHDDRSQPDYPAFEIRASLEPTEPDFSLLADIGICPDCQRELFDSHNRRYLHPFISCAHCGPRFTIIEALPYDRPATTMDEFALCEHCRQEYNDPLARRFRAHAIACPECGPFVALREVHSQFPGSGLRISSIECRTSAILKARRLLREGYVLGVKGLGGFHLACDASNSLTVEELRDRTGRLDAPFALMAADVEVARSICQMNTDEEALLTGREKPIVLLEKKLQSGADRKLSKWVAPNLDTLGVMLPYTALHHLLLNQTDPLLAAEPAPALLVMTSGNFAEKPAATDDEDALLRLAPLVDGFIVHNRRIRMRCDASVVRVDHRQSSVVHVRRSRGYAPYAVSLPVEVKPTLAIGAESNNTICLAHNRQAYLSPHIGQLQNTETFESFEQSIQHLSHLCAIRPEVLAYELQPNDWSGQYAQRAGLPRVSVQHHHAHIVSCMVDNSLSDRQVIGLCFDRKGFGWDGAVWGGEVLVASYSQAERFGHLEYVPLPHGDTLRRTPASIAQTYAHFFGIDLDGLPLPRMHHILREPEPQDKRLLTSSIGFLFDAVACLTGVRNEITYEAQAVMEMEGLAKPFVSVAAPYPYTIEGDRILQIRDLLNAIVHDVRANRSIEIIAARFHKTIALAGVDLCKRARSATGLNEVVLSGDLWLNLTLLKLVREGLKQAGFTVYSHKHVPTSDGGLALGQAVIANCSNGSPEFVPALADDKPSNS